MRIFRSDEGTTTEGSTKRLIQLCGGYFLFYVITGVAVKYFGNKQPGFPAMNDLEYLVYSTIGGSAICVATVLARGWYRLQSNREVRVGRVGFPVEYLYIIPSGVCTAVVIPTTTLMYSLPISVMVAMVIMRGSVIVISRFVDFVQIRQGILKKKVYWEENVAVLFALSAMSIHLFWSDKVAGFDFLESTAALTILGSYIAAYLVRIYIMNYYKNTRPEGARLDNHGFFGIEQLAASGTMAVFAVCLFFSPAFAPALFGADDPRIATFRGAFLDPHTNWPGAVMSGVAYGIVAFFSVFIFMFKGRTATFAGLVNRLTSLIAGTAATLIAFVVFHASPPKPQDWGSLALILVAVAFLTRAEKRRTREFTEPGATAAQSTQPALAPAIHGTGTAGTSMAEISRMAGIRIEGANE